MHDIAASPVGLDVVCEGTPRAMGIAQGEAQRAKIHAGHRALEELEAFRLEQPRWLPYPIFLALAHRRARRLLEGGLARDFPRVHERMLGIAEGAEISPGAVFLLNALEALMCSTNGRVRMPALGSCSAVALRGARTETGEPVVAHNFDYLPIVAPLYLFRESRPREGRRSLDFTVAPLAGTIDGMNDAGLCITYNYAFTTDATAAPASPISAAISEALAQCDTVSEAAEWIAQRPRRGSGILMMADEGGDIASLELSNTQSKLRRPAKGEDAIFHTNCYMQEPMRAMEVPGDALFNGRAPKPLRGVRVLQSAQERQQRFGQLLNEEGAVGPDELARLMADHGAGGSPSSDTLCMHGAYWQTTACIQYYPRSRRVRASYGYACQAEYVEMELA